MNLSSQRPWITPLVIGSFLLSAVTGLLMFFHLDSGLNKLAHEWLSWAMLVGVGLHLGLNQLPFKRYFQQPLARGVMAGFAALLLLSFLPVGGTAGGQPPFAAPVQALARAPLPALAQIASLSPEALRARLGAAGLVVTNDAQTLQDIVGPELRAQINALNRILPPNTAPR
ncbi:MAG: DUF4405 domain-containing protein [Rhodoferax sp.]|jgi:hypothetical protein|nr:DUF4405 domain-containing protein [Rhodoferax sp.]